MLPLEKNLGENWIYFLLFPILKRKLNFLSLCFHSSGDDCDDNLNASQAYLFVLEDYFVTLVVVRSE